MEKKGARPHARRRASATRPRGAGASERPPRPSCSWGGAFPPLPPLLLPAWTPAVLLRSGCHSHAARLPFPFLASPFPRIRIGAGSAPGARQGAQGLLWPLSSLSPSTVPPGPRRPRPVRHVPRGVSAADGPLPAHFWTWLPQFSCPVLPAVPQPHRPPLLAPSLLLRPSPLGCALLAPSVFRVLALL